jgi:trigger factor
LEYEITVDNECEKELQVRAPAEELEPFIEGEVDELRKKAAVKGYRKGRVPRDLLKSKYRDNIRANALNDLITDAYLKVLKEKNWQPASRVELLNLEEGNPIQFRLRFQVIPDFQIDTYDGLEIMKEQPLPEEFLFEQGLNSLRERFAEIREITGPAVVDNFVTLDLEILENGQVKDKQPDITIRIGDRNFPDEINRALVGSQRGQTKEAQGEKTLYRLTVKKIEEKVLPNTDDEFAVKLNFKNYEELKAKLIEDLKHKEEQRVEDEMKESIANVLLERVRFSVPKILVDEEYEKILKKRNIPDSDSAREQFQAVAERRIRFNLILDKIGQKENIQTPDDDIQKTVEALGITLNDENREEITDYFRNIMTREKTIDFLYQHAKIGEKGKILSPKEAKDANRPVRH